MPGLPVEWTRRKTTPLRAKEASCMTKPLLIVVDDQPAITKFVDDVAVKIGFEVRSTFSAREFQQAYLSTDPVGIVMDIVMPDMDGNELLQWLAEQGSMTPVVLMSGYDDQYLDTAKRLGEARGVVVVGTLVKPFLMGELEKILVDIFQSQD